MKGFKKTMLMILGIIGLPIYFVLPAWIFVYIPRMLIEMILILAVFMVAAVFIVDDNE